MTRFFQDLLIIIVKYNRELIECESFVSLYDVKLNEGEKLSVLVYDNSPLPQKISEHKGFEIFYFHDALNPGISKAYNVGVQFAKDQQKKWALLLDQDTRIPNTVFHSYRQAITQNPNINLFVPILKLKSGRIFSPSRYRFKRGFFLKNISSGIHSLFRLAPVNSGMLIKTSTFFEVGGYNEKVKLDFADFQFIERLRKKHSDFFLIDEECIQDFSDNSSSISNQKIRFEFYCEGAKAIDKRSFLDWLQYNTIVLLRALRLTARFHSMFFLRTYVRKFLL